METKVRKEPGPSHPITVEPAKQRVVVTYNGQVVADSHRALTLRESDYPAVHYIPRGDVDMSLLERSDRTTYCPYKGDASYFHIATENDRASDAVWTYEAPYAAVEPIREYVAFYPEAVDAIELI